MSEAAFLRDICEHPGDDAPRLVAIRVYDEADFDELGPAVRRGGA